MRILSERMENGQYVVRAEGRAGASYVMRVRAPLAGGGETVRTSAGTARVTPAAAGAWRDVGVQFPRDGANDDGYVTLTLAFGGR